MKILNFGSCNIDHVYRVSHFVGAGETIGAESLTVFPGGKGLNQSLAMARAGLSVCHAGAIGEDGLFLREILGEAGVDTEYLITLEGRPTGHAIIQVDEDGHNCIIVCGGANAAVGESDVDRVLSHFGEGDILVLQNELTVTAYIIKAAAARGMRIFFNPSPFEKGLSALDLSGLDTLIVNEVEAEGFSGETTIEGICSFFRERYPHLRVIVTLGARGSMYFDSERKWLCPAFCVPAVDTTSAGDTFSGYYIAGVVSGLETEEALRLASAASALCVSRRGAAASIPTAEETRKALEQLSPGEMADLHEKRRSVLSLIENDPIGVTLTDIADHLGYSPSWTAVWFKRQIGCTFVSYVQEEKLKKAAALLRETAMPISQIITACGYENAGFFREKFKARYGCMPLTYRKQKRGE